ncbi:hypothetical protein Bca52824_011214 [Brassica carinata]|uniref:Uncharacterized protein n=1 Tax=Brassica carinata TaxID=52824 RepID=A0A8X7WE90_BRACI|nr:hypothetical protein Bca52824_011214 [Brassica carinata]
MRRCRYEPHGTLQLFGGLTCLKAAERKLVDIHFLVDKEVEELATTMDTMQQEAEKFQRQLDITCINRIDQ